MFGKQYLNMFFNKNEVMLNIRILFNCQKKLITIYLKYKNAVSKILNLCNNNNTHNFLEDVYGTKITGYF